LQTLSIFISFASLRVMSFITGMPLVTKVTFG
jgi:hypothetical protein